MKNPEKDFEAIKQRAYKVVQHNALIESVVPYMDMLKKLDVKVLSIKHQPVDRLYYVVHDSRTYMSPVATKFHKYVLSCN